MTVTAVGNKAFRLTERVFKISRFVHCKYGRKFFVRKFFGKFNAFNFTDKNFCSLGNLNAGKFCNPCGALSHNFCIKGAVDDDCFSYFFRLRGVKEIASPACELGFYRVIYAFEDDNRLLGSTNHTVIKCL